MTYSEKLKLYQVWKQLINMSAGEIIDWATSDYGKAAGISRSEAKEKGIRSGRDSALALVRMLPKGRGFVSAFENWSPAEWRWAKAQVGFIKRMLGMRKRITGNPYIKDGKPTRWLSALRLWGHDPRKRIRKTKYLQSWQPYFCSALLSGEEREEMQYLKLIMP